MSNGVPSRRTFTFFKKDLNKMGKVLMESHISLRDLYSVSCLEIDYLIDISTNF